MTEQLSRKDAQYAAEMEEARPSLTAATIAFPVIAVIPWVIGIITIVWYLS